MCWLGGSILSGGGGEVVALMGSSETLRYPRWAQTPLWVVPISWSVPTGGLMANEVSFLYRGSYCSGQVPEPACARLSLGTLLPCQGTPASGAK